MLVKNSEAGSVCDRGVDADEAAAVVEVALERFLLGVVQDVALGVQEHDRAVLLQMLLVELRCVVGHLDHESVLGAELPDLGDARVRRGELGAVGLGEDEDPELASRARVGRIVAVGWRTRGGRGEREREAGYREGRQPMCLFHRNRLLRRRVVPRGAASAARATAGGLAGWRPKMSPGGVCASACSFVSPRLARSGTAAMGVDNRRSSAGLQCKVIRRRTIFCRNGGRSRCGSRAGHVGRGGEPPVGRR